MFPPSSLPPPQHPHPPACWFWPVLHVGNFPGFLVGRDRLFVGRGPKSREEVPSVRVGPADRPPLRVGAGASVRGCWFGVCGSCPRAGRSPPPPQESLPASHRKAEVWAPARVLGAVGEETGAPPILVQKPCSPLPGAPHPATLVLPRQESTPTSGARRTTVREQLLCQPALTHSFIHCFPTFGAFEGEAIKCDYLCGACAVLRSPSSPLGTPTVPTAPLQFLSHLGSRCRP